MKLTVETPTGTHVFTGDTVETKTVSTTLRIIVDNEHVASFREWTNWRTEKEGTN